jgi:tetratricopeptide (TPR) repeat protein
MKQDPDLDPLRPRADFKRLLAEPAGEPPLKNQAEKPAAGDPVSQDEFQLAEKRLAEGKHAAAIQLFDKVHQERAKSLGADHPQTRAALYGLGRAYLAYGEGDQAIACFEQCLVLGGRVFPSPPETTAVRRSLAEAARSVGKSAEAVRLLEEVARAYAAELGPDHPTTLSASAELAAAYRDVGRLDEARRLFDTALQGMTVKLGPDHLVTLQTQVQLAELHLASRRYADAEAIARAAYECSEHRQQRTQSNDSGHPLSGPPSLGLNDRAWGDVASLPWLLGECLSRQGKFAEAEPLLLKGYEGMKQRADKLPPRTKDPRLRQALERLVQLYEAWGKKDQADDWRKKLEEAKAPAIP